MKHINKAIALDLDGVIADIASSLEDELYMSNIIEQGNFEEWIIKDTKNKNILAIYNNPLFWKNMKPYKDAWHQVNYWFSLGYDINIITARRQPNAISETIPWLENWNINTMKPIFCNLGEKVNYITKINPIFVIEDNPHEIKKIEAAGVKCYLRAHSYNQKYWNEFITIESLFEIDLEN
jgi:hypothetical protein